MKSSNQRWTGLKRLSTWFQEQHQEEELNSGKKEEKKPVRFSLKNNVKGWRSDNLSALWPALLLWICAKDFMRSLLNQSCHIYHIKKAMRLWAWPGIFPSLCTRWSTFMQLRAADASSPRRTRSSRSSRSSRRTAPGSRYEPLLFTTFCPQHQKAALTPELR